MSNEQVKTQVAANPVVEALKTAQPAPQAGEPKAAPAPATGMTPELIKLMQQVLELKAKVDAGDKNGAKKVAKAEPEIDWTKITEKDITNLDINIPIIEQQVPEYLNVVLSDKNYISRWVHIMGQRLGVCLASGYTYIVEADLDPNYPRFLNFDTNGHYSFGDVVCLRILKSRYLPALKANYAKTMAIHGRSKLQQAVISGKSSVHLDKFGSEIKTNESMPEELNPGGLQIFDPGDEQLPGERVYTKDMFSV